MSLFDIFNTKQPWLKYYKKNERKVEIPNGSIYDFLYKNSLYHLRNNAINYFGKNTTYEELLDEIDICARAMKSQGVRAKDVVSICLPNIPEAVILFYAVNKIGAIANMIHPLSAEEELKKTINDTKSVILFTINFNYKKIDNIISQTNLYKVVLVSPKDSMPETMKLVYYFLNDRKIKVPKKSEVYTLWNDFFERGYFYNRDVLVEGKSKEKAVILHSGGTSGTPKSIVLSNGNINVVIDQARIALPENNDKDSMLGILPMFHCFGLVECVHYPLCIGATLILIPKFDAGRFDKLLKKYHPSIIPGVPTLFEALIKSKHMNNVDLSNVKYVVSGGDSLNEERNLKINEFLKAHNCKNRIVQGYGMTETSGGCIFSTNNSYTLGSIGIPLPSNNVKIVDPDTKKLLKFGKIGEIMISGPSVMMGYLNDKEETNKVLEKDEKGVIWVHTGDLGYMDKNGCLFFVQRLKRLIISSGYNVYPSHIEEILNKHEYVLNSCIVGIPHPYKVQVPKAYVVLKEGLKDTSKIQKELKEYCEKNLAKYMIPKEFVFRETLPKTMVGKVDYKKLEQEK